MVTALDHHPGEGSTLTTPDAKNSAPTATALSTQAGEISIVGGIETIRSLFLRGLIDELTLTTHPVLTNEGRRLFDHSVPLTRLRLLRTAQTKTGNAVLTYGLARQD